MSIVALSHGYPPLWNMGGEVSLHRTLKAMNGEKNVLTRTESKYVFEGVNVYNINTPDVLDIYANPYPITKQIVDLGARVVIGQNELSLPAVLAARKAEAISVVNVHTPPRYGRGIHEAMLAADYAIYNTHTAAKEWGEPRALVVHPPTIPATGNINSKGDAYTLLSSLVNKGVEVVLELAKKYPEQRFIIVRSPAEKTHGLPNLERRVAKLPNIELHQRVAPEQVHKYLEQTRILLVPSRYETYGMSAIEAAEYGIPSIHVDTPHVREGIGDAAILIEPLDTDAAARGINLIEKNYQSYSDKARNRSEFLRLRQEQELTKLAEFMDAIQKPISNRGRMKAVALATKRYFR